MSTIIDNSGALQDDEPVSKHPRGVGLLIFCEMWERFSFFGMKGILVLFLTAGIADGGFAWSPGQAVALVGLYSGMVYLLGVVGGLAGDRWMGSMRAVLIGGLVLVTGHIALALPDAMPTLVEWVTGLPTQDTLFRAAVPFGAIAMSPADIAQITAAAASPDQAGAARYAYGLASWSFYIGIALIALGTGLFKPNITVLLSSLYGVSHPRREAGFNLFYIGINVGSFSAPFIAGSLGERVGWSYGFAAAAIGMAVAMMAFALRYRWLQTRLRARNAPAHGQKSYEFRNPSWWRGLMILGVGATVFWAASEQMFGFLTLFIYQDVDRSLAGFTIPATWFQAVNPFLIIVLAPLFATMWTGLAVRGRNPHILTKFVVGLALLALAFLAMRTAVTLNAGTGKIAMGWIVLTYFLLTLAELILWTTSLAFVSALAPPRQIGLIMGFWYVSMAAGGWLGGQLGTISTRLSPADAFTMMAAIAGVTALILLSVRRVARTWLN